MPRLEALAEKGDRQECLSYGALIQPLRDAEARYHAERDAYLAEEERKHQEAQAQSSVRADQLLAQLPQEVIQQIATQTGALADWHQWPAELKSGVEQAIMESQGNE